MAHRPQPNVGGATYPPLPVGGRPAGARGDTGKGAGHRGCATIIAGRGDLQRPSRPRHAACSGHSPTPEVSLGGLDDSWSHFGVPMRSAGLRCRFVGLSLGLSPRPWFQVVCPIVFLFLLFIYEDIGKPVPLHP
jgi:hypothetical protein